MQRERNTLTLRQRWTLDDISWDRIEPQLMADQEILFYLVLSASFIETATDTYTRNLVDYYADDPVVANWLSSRWQHEELQHGSALRRYAETAWPAIDWPGTYERFFGEFSAKCAEDALESSHTLEAVSRCIVEMGTATYYLSMSRLSPEPVLARLAGLIREDEVRHYKYFLRYFHAYQERERAGRLSILGAILRRLRMIDVSDSSIALKHAYAMRHPGAPYDKRIYRALQKRIKQAVGKRFPIEMSAKMTLKPLDLSPSLQKTVISVLTPISRYMLGTSREARP
ncbi:MAG TPA: ferritin-like domain-containing protein [Gammaproteobacteria bacterium]|nr:ferritin-like domain-containing protein [Gammaproteobacteria bacterium]